MKATERRQIFAACEEMADYATFRFESHRRTLHDAVSPVHAVELGRRPWAIGWSAEVRGERYGEFVASSDVDYYHKFGELLRSAHAVLTKVTEKGDGA